MLCSPGEESLESQASSKANLENEWYKTQLKGYGGKHYCGNKRARENMCRQLTEQNEEPGLLLALMSFIRIFIKAKMQFRAMVLNECKLGKMGGNMSSSQYHTAVFEKVQDLAK